MQTRRRHRINVTASPLAARAPRETADTAGQTLVLTGVPVWRGKTDSTDSILSSQETQLLEVDRPTDQQDDQQDETAPADVATQLVPEISQETELVQTQGMPVGAYEGHHTARAHRSRASRRRMKAASRIAYRPAKLKGNFPTGWIIATILGFVILIAMLSVYLSFSYFMQQVSNSC